MWTLITHVGALVVGLGGGYYVHYKFGTKLASLESKVKAVV